MPMNMMSFVNALAQRASDFVLFVSRGSQWELKAHDIIFDVIENLTGHKPVPEFPYKNLTGSDTKTSCDILCQDGANYYAIEVKVESATNQNQYAGKTLAQAKAEDVAKLTQLKTYQFDVASKAYDGADNPNRWCVSVANSLSRWFLVIAWSPKARGDIQANQTSYSFTYAVVNQNILFAVYAVP